MVTSVKKTAAAAATAIASAAAAAVTVQIYHVYTPGSDFLIVAFCGEVATDLCSSSFRRIVASVK